MTLSIPKGAHANRVPRVIGEVWRQTLSCLRNANPVCRVEAIATSHLYPSHLTIAVL
jgi:hypothetical protein